MRGCRFIPRTVCLNMIIADPANLEGANERFNYFHDGFLRRIALTRDSEFLPISPAGSREELEEFWNGTTVEFEIRHSNYDNPNQPANRLIKIRATGCIGLLENIERFLGKSIFDLRFAGHPKGVACLLTSHADEESFRSMENGTQISLFVAESIEIEETTEGEGR